MNIVAVGRMTVAVRTSIYRAASSVHLDALGELVR